MKTPCLTTLILALLASLCPLAADAALNAPVANRADQGGLFPIDDHLRRDGTILDGVNLGSPASIPSFPIEIVTATAPNPSGTNWSTVGPNVASNLEGDPRIDPFFYSEIWGDNVSLTYRNLDPTHRYVIQIGHGEPRDAFAGRFSNNDFVLDNNTILQVPSFQLGNNIARENPPAPDDLALITLEVFGVSTFTYNMREAEGATRGPSISLFQVRDITAATHIVTSPANSGPGTLRQAIADATNNDTIVFDPTVFNGEAADTIVLSSQLTVSGKIIAIDAGNIPGGVTVSGNDAVRVFDVEGTGNLTLRALTLTDGRSDFGGAIYSFGTLVLENCTVSDNTAIITGGGINVFSGSLTATNCTFTDNTAEYAGAIHGGDVSNATTLRHCTISGNTGNQFGGGIIARGTSTIENTIIAGNFSPNGPDINFENGTLTPLGNNLIGSNSGNATAFPAGSPNANGDYVNVAHGLNIPADNGGPGRTLIPLPGSPAIDNGVLLVSTSPGLDQRGLRRSATAPDIGAVETDWVGGTTGTAPGGLPGFGTILTPADTIIGSSGNTPPNGLEEVENAIDDSLNTKYLNFDRLNTGFDITPCVGPTRVLGISLTSANDAPGRDPATFVLLGSNKADSGFQPIASGIVPPFPGRFTTQKLYFPSVSATYRHYRLIFPTVASTIPTDENNSMQIDEVELLGRAVDPTLRIPKFSLGRIEGATRYYDLVWVSEPNATYRLRSSFDLKTWTNVSGGTGIPSGGAASHLELSSFDPAINFRIEKEP